MTDKCWWLYIIETKYQHLYTGITTDPQRRFLEHQSSGPKAAKALRGKGPLQMVFKQCLASKRQAMQLEYRVKALNKKQKLQLIEGALQLEGLLPKTEVEPEPTSK